MASSRSSVSPQGNCLALLIVQSCDPVFESIISFEPLVCCMSFQTENEKIVALQKTAKKTKDVHKNSKMADRALVHVGLLTCAGKSLLDSWPYGPS